MHPSTCAEKGIFCLGSQTTDSSALRWVQEKGTTRNSAVVICGTGLNALVAAGNLMHNGVHADRISLVINEDAIEEIGHELVSSYSCQEFLIVACTMSLTCLFPASAFQDK